MIHYEVSIEHNGKKKVVIMEATSPGGAFAKAAKKYPGCKLISAWWGNQMGGEWFEVTYEPVSQVKVAAEKTRPLTQNEFTLDDPRRPRPRR